MIRLLMMILMATLVQGCVLTKVVSVPMRVAGAVISVVPVAGNTVHDSIDTAADVVDDLPL